MVSAQPSVSNQQFLSSQHPKLCLPWLKRQRVAASRSLLLSGGYNELLYYHIVGRSCRRIAKIDKVTKTQIVVNNARFRRDSGWQCGGDRWNVREISVPTEKDIQDVKEENLRRTLIYAISSFDFKRLTTNELKQVYNIVKSKENERT